MISLPKAAAIAVATFFVTASPSLAQFWDKITNPEMEVPIKHPPQVVIREGQKVAVREFSGAGGAELSDRFVHALSSSSSLGVVDRANLEAVLNEHGLSLAAAYSPEAARKLSQTLGCGAIFTGRVTRVSVETSPILKAGTETRYENKQKVEYPKYQAKVTARIVASVQLVELATGRTHTGKMIDVNKELINEGVGGVPEYPSRDQALSLAYEQAIAELKRMVLPWVETVNLTVYNDNKYGLKQSAEHIKRGDFPSATALLHAEVGRANESADPKGVAKVYYNLGISTMYAGDPDAALPFLTKSSQLRPTDITSSAITTAKQMIALNQQAQVREANALDLDKPVVAARATGVSNQQIIEMAQAGLPDAIIIAKIKADPSGVTTRVEDLISLKKAGISDGVMLAITEAARPN